MMIDKICVFGASITGSPWWTWKDFLSLESSAQIFDLSRKGAGNTYMLNSLLNIDLDQSWLVVGMLTSVDKFDWYVEGDRYRHLARQKHQPIEIGPDSGFWCTGSWFPLEKQEYRDKFYSLDYFVAQTVQQICMIKYLCAAKNCRVEIFFDSPIWWYTEQDLNRMVMTDHHCKARNLLGLPLASKWRDLLQPHEINHADESLIGYCWRHELPWANAYYKAHPPSSSHLQFYTDIVRPRLDQHIELTPIKGLDHKIQEMDRLWKDR